MADRPALGDDQPKKNPWTEDRLNYSPFAKRIADVVISQPAPDGYVIGIHGKWSTGKSTAINFIISFINKHNSENPDNQVIHIDFRPWIISGHQDLIIAFFKILSEQLGGAEGRWRRRWRGPLGILQGTTDNLVDAAATVALTIDPTGVAAGFGASVAKKSIDQLLSRFLKDPSLQTAYENLKKQLAQSGKRFLVTIDDIDRLEDNDVRAIMQMVKTIGQLPNVVYLLSYDRNIVSDILDKRSRGDNPRFVEKIIQQELDLPKPSQSSLLSMLEEEISFLSEDVPDDMRWYYVVRDGLHRWIRSPRDVVRLSNAIKFAWPALEGELDPLDLLAMEGLRLFDPGAFAWVRDNRDFLLSEGRFLWPQDDERQKAAETLKHRIPSESRAQVLRILTVLFPHEGKWFEGRDISGEASSEIQRRRGVATKAGYDTYFSLHPSSDAIPKAVVKDILSHLDDADYCERIVRAYLNKTNSRGDLMIGALLDELRVEFIGAHATIPQQGLLNALFEVGEEIASIDRDFGMLQLSPDAYLTFLIRNMLHQWGTEEAGSHLVQAFEKCNSVMFLADQFVDRGRELGEFHSQSPEAPVVTLETFEKLGYILLKKLKAAEANGTLSNPAYYFNIVRSWAYLTGPEEPRTWLTQGIIENAIFMVKAARGLLNYSVGTKVRQYTMREPPDPELFDLEVLLSAGRKHLEEPTLTEEQRKILTAVVRGVQRFKSGSSPGGQE